jgi:hypothetical protein
MTITKYNIWRNFPRNIAKIAYKTASTKFTIIHEVETRCPLKETAQKPHQCSILYRKQINIWQEYKNKIWVPLFGTHRHIGWRWWWGLPQPPVRHCIVRCEHKRRPFPPPIWKRETIHFENICVCSRLQNVKENIQNNGRLRNRWMYKATHETSFIS